MIENATILRIDTPQPSGPDGTVAMAAGPAIAVRGCLDAPSYAQRFSLGNVGQDLTAVLYVDTASGLAAEPRSNVIVLLDGDVNRTYQVLHRVRWQKDGGLSHDEVFLKAL